MTRLLSALLIACAAPVAEDPCTRAEAFVLRCGAQLPLLAEASCTGIARGVATCIIDHARSCDELGDLPGLLEDCTAAADTLDDLDSVPVPETPPEGEAAPPATTFEKQGAFSNMLALETDVLAAGTYLVSVRSSEEVDLYLGRATAPTATDFDCRSVSPGGNEACAAALFAPGRLFMLLTSPADVSFRLTVTAQ